MDTEEETLVCLEHLLLHNLPHHTGFGILHLKELYGQESTLKDGKQEQNL